MKRVRPSIQYKELFSNALKEGPIVHMGLTNRDSFTKERFDDNPEHYFDTLNDVEQSDITTPNGIALKFDYHRLFWLINDDQFIGCCSLRFSTDPQTTHFIDHNTGHFGQSIVKSLRSQGYGSQQWQLAKIKLKKLGLEYAIRGAHPDNIASWKGIDRTGGHHIHTTTSDALGWGLGKMYRFDL